MKQKGFVSILGFLLLIILVLFGIGSYFVIQEQNAQNAPAPTPYFAPVTVDKTNIVQGEVLVTFKTGTTYSQATRSLQNQGINNFQTVAAFSDEQQLTSADVFKLTVEVGTEADTVTTLGTNSLVSTASLSYK